MLLVNTWRKGSNNKERCISSCNFSVPQPHHQKNEKLYYKNVKPNAFRTFFLSWMTLCLCKSKVNYAVLEVFVSRFFNQLYVVVCHLFPHHFASLSLNRLSYSFVTCWVVIGACWHWQISDCWEDGTRCDWLIARRTSNWIFEIVIYMPTVAILHYTVVPVILKIMFWHSVN